MNKPQIHLIGCGAVGALYGLRLHTLLGSSQVRFLVDETRKSRYEEEGIFLNGKRAPFSYDLPNEVPIADLIIIATKHHNLDDAMEMMKHSVGEKTIILSLLNGIDSEALLAKEFGAEHVLYGFAVGLNSTHEGKVITYTREGRIVFGEKDNQRSERIENLVQLFEQAGIETLVPVDIHQAQWNKFMLNTAYNTISGLCRATYGDLAQESIRTLAYQVSGEVQAVAKAEGIVLEDSLVDQNHKVVTALGFEGKTSMCQDMEAGRKTENNWFCASVERLGRIHHIPTPVCSTLSLLVRGYEGVQLRLSKVQ